MSVFGHANRLWAVFASILLCMSPAHAGMCGYDYCWGALAIGSGWASGRATGMRTAPDAHDLALQRCGPDCETVEVFYNSCAAIAGNRDGTWTFGLGETRREAETRAMTACEDEGSWCQFRVWACSR